MMTPAMLRTRPVFTISKIFILLEEKIIVFGGVATGSMNAIEAESVAVIIRSNGLIPMATETEAKIGRIICVVAVFDVSSVRNVIKVAVIIIIHIGENDENPSSC